MLCEDARDRLRTGIDAEAEAHLAECVTCFAVLEERDPLVDVLRAARPRLRAVPPAIASGVLRRWRPARVSWRLGLAATAGLLVLAIALAALIFWLAPAALARPLRVASNALDVAATVVNGVLVAPRALLLDRPWVLAGSGALAIGVCGLWVRLYQSLEFQRRRVIQ